MPVSLNYQIYGEGNPIFILHGLFGSGRNWNTIARQLSRDNQIITVDLRNHGASGHAETMDYPKMAEDLVQLVSDLELDTIDLLGHSMGGKTAMTLALLYPERVNRLIVVDIAPVSYSLNHDELVDALRSVPVDTLNSRGEADSLLAERIPEAGLRQYLLQNLLRDGDNYRWRLNLDAIHANHTRLRGFPEEVSDRTFAGSALFLTGDQSDFVLPEHSADIKRYFPSAQQQVIEGANHWVHADKPDQVVRAVSDFLKGSE